MKTFNAFADDEELRSEYRAEADSIEEAIPDIIRKMLQDPDTPEDAELRAEGQRIAVLRDGDPEPEDSLEVREVEE